MELTNIRQIVGAVRNIRSMSNSPFRRTVPKLDYAKARQRWWIELRFNSEIDLMILEKAVTGSGLRINELAGTFYLEDPRIPDHVNFAVAYDLAEKFVSQLNGTVPVLCSAFQPVVIESIVELFENGTGRGVARHDIVVHGMSSLESIRAFLQGNTSLKGLLPIADRDENVREAFFFIGAPGNVWANLYKVSEIVEESMGRAPDLFQNDLCTRADWNRFRMTANHQEATGVFSRHARTNAQPPADPMTPIEAKLFIVGLVKRWVAHLSSSASKTE